MGIFRHVIALLLSLVVSAVPGLDLHSYARVKDDGTLRVSNRTVHLYGIYIPPTNRQCRTQIRPVRCAPRAALALEFKIQGFVFCESQRRNRDGSIQAVCYVDRTPLDPGEDLAAYLLRNGWALARPEAPFEYHALERIARSRELGVWGFPVDSITHGNSLP